MVLGGSAQPTKTCFGMEAEFSNAQNTQLRVSDGIPTLTPLYVIIMMLQLIGTRLRSMSEAENFDLASP